MSLPFCGYLAANLQVASNLARADATTAQVAVDAAVWGALIARAAAIGCKLQRCYLDPSCDGDCGCGPGIADVNGFSVRSEMPGTDDNEIAMYTRLVERAEANGGSIR